MNDDYLFVDNAFDDYEDEDDDFDNGSTIMWETLILDGRVPCHVCGEGMIVQQTEAPAECTACGYTVSSPEDVPCSIANW
jgi:rubrerythrin